MLSRLSCSAAIVGFCLAFAPALDAQAQNYKTAPHVHVKTEDKPGDWDVTVGAGALFAPEYEGSDEYEVRALPFVDVEYKDRVRFNVVDGLQVSAFKTDNIDLGVGLSADFGRDDSDGDRLNGIGDIDPAIEAHLFAKVKHERVDASITIAQDTGLTDDGHDGTTIDLQAGYAIPVSQKLFVRPSLSTTWASDRYMESYFGISNAQAANSRAGLRQFSTESGFKDITGNVLGVYRLNENWSVNGLGRVTQLLGDAADSPIVEDETQLMLGSFVTYTFD